MDIDFCLNTSSIWQFVGYAIYVVKIIVPIILIVMGIIELSKCVVSGKDDEIKSTFSKLIRKLIIAILIFFVPTITRLVFSMISAASESMVYAEGCITCLVAPFNETCTSAVSTAKEARASLNYELYNTYYEFVKNKNKKIDHSGEQSGGNPGERPSDGGSGGIDIGGGGTPINDNDTSCTAEYRDSVVKTEPNPLRVLSCYPDSIKVSDYVNKGNLGAWPANYESIPKSIGSCGSNQFLFPVNGNYNAQSGTHPGLDIGWIIGTPVYAPASGSISFRWGESLNDHGGESNYSIAIFLSNPFTITVDGKKFTVDTLWFAHMLGVVSRTDGTVKQGDLIGYRGTAHFESTGASLAAHVHLGFKGTWEGTTEKVFLSDTQIISSISSFKSYAGQTIKAGTCLGL